MQGISVQDGNFNPRSREGSDSFSIVRIIFKPISIHAPAKGATNMQVMTILNSDDFNLRSREGSDVVIIFSFLCFTYFNPRSREGSDLYTVHRQNTGYISIHAPAKGATHFYIVMA